ncbi:MAG: galactonate dehydratase [Synergistaceae bacterium]|jgi:galactonate dehydratase|nr:galactonate dehydratase [Synergistaceae bacterium]MDD3690003.1 galactonate dehydratase [Synergistaceae bacterium]MDD4022386.1 galactonate dehydratase [Synergistaceae bacterium]
MARIDRFDLFKVPPRWLFLKITTDEGGEGWGEPVVEGRADTVAAAVREMGEYLVGADPTRIEDLWQTLYRGGFYRGGPILMSAISGIEQALWDISGKMAGLPVHRMLGGAVRDKMRVYSWIGGDRPDDVVAEARKRVDAGMNAVKMNGTEEMAWIDSFTKVEEVLSRVQALRDAFGYSLDIAVDFHGRVHLPMARVLMKELEPFRLMFIEEPVLVENREAFRELRQHTVTPVATGERNFSRWDFKDLITGGAVDILQPDLSHAGGIWEVRKIAAMAEAYDLAVAPHCPLGPIALAACLQLDFCTPNAFIQEQSLGIHYNQGTDLLDYLADPSVFQYRDGHVSLPEGPGLGITVNEEVVLEKSREGHNWRNPVWRNADGSVAEW